MPREKLGSLMIIKSRTKGLVIYYRERGWGYKMGRLGVGARPVLPLQKGVEGHNNVLAMLKRGTRSLIVLKWGGQQVLR